MLNSTLHCLTAYVFTEVSPSTDCYQNQGSFISCSLCSGVVCQCVNRQSIPSFSKYLLNIKGHWRMSWPSLYLHWREPCFKSFSSGGNVGAWRKCNSPLHSYCSGSQNLGKVMPCNGRAFDLVKCWWPSAAGMSWVPHGDWFWLFSTVEAAQSSWQTTLREKREISLVMFSGLVLIVTCMKWKKKQNDKANKFFASAVFLPAKH